MNPNHSRPEAAAAFAPATSRILALAQPGDGQIRTRKVVSRSRTRSTGKYPSWKMRRMLQWESVHELNAFRLLDADPSVSAFREQPLVITYVDGGEEHKHYPDIEVIRGPERQLWEIKTDADAADPAVRNRTRLMQCELPRFGYSYCVVTADDLSQQPRLLNALTLLRHGRRQVNPVDRERLRRQFEKRRTVAWGEIVEGAWGPAGKAQACRLLLEGVLQVDICGPLDRDAIVSLRESVMERGE